MKIHTAICITLFLVPFRSDLLMTNLARRKVGMKIR